MNDRCDYADSIDEMLETFWELRERGTLDRASLADKITLKAVEMLEAKGMLSFDGNIPALTEDAEDRAHDIVRRHRLAERLFHDVLDLSNYEDDACTFEHVISKNVEEALCTFLGHPPACPHGKPIPKGACCSALSKKYTPLITNLSNVEVGTDVVVAFLNTSHIEKLTAMGLAPGSTVRLMQKRPTMVIQVEETTLALDNEIVKGIFVRTTS